MYTEIYFAWNHRTGTCFRKQCSSECVYKQSDFHALQKLISFCGIGLCVCDYYVHIYLCITLDVFPPIAMMLDVISFACNLLVVQISWTYFRLSSPTLSIRCGMAISTKPLIFTAFLLVMLWTPVYTKDVCTDYIAKKPLYGYHCPADKTTIRRTHVAHHICRHHCVSLPQCSMVSYDANNHVCLLHSERCVEMVPNREQAFSSMMLY